MKTVGFLDNPKVSFFTSKKIIKIDFKIFFVANERFLDKIKIIVDCRWRCQHAVERFQLAAIH